MRYDDLKKVEKGIRRFFHDDITVVVIFLDNDLLHKNALVPELSVRGFVDTIGPSNFNILREILTWMLHSINWKKFNPITWVGLSLLGEGQVH